VDALGNPVGFHLTAGQASDLEGADQLLPDVDADMVLGAKGYDADERVIEPLRAPGKTAVIPPRRNRKSLREYDKELYKVRHLIENFFAKLKQYRAISTGQLRRATISGQRTFSVQFISLLPHLAYLMTRPRIAHWFRYGRECLQMAHYSTV
jgi:transposase